MDIVANYYSWLINQTNTQQIDNNTIKISLPFLDRLNDCVDIYLLNKTGSDYILTDDGETMRELELSGYKLNERRMEFACGIAASCGASINEKNSLCIESKADDLPLKIHMLLQCMIRISDLNLMKDAPVKAFFNDDVAAFLSTYNIKYKANYSLIGRSRLPCQFDYVIYKNNAAPQKYIKAISHLDNIAAKVLLFGWEDTKETRNGNGQLFVFIDNVENKIKKEALSSFTVYGITSVEWSNRMEVVDRLAS